MKIVKKIKTIIYKKLNDENARLKQTNTLIRESFIDKKLELKELKQELENIKKRYEMIKFMKELRSCKN